MSVLDLPLEEQKSFEVFLKIFIDGFLGPFSKVCLRRCRPSRWLRRLPAFLSQQCSWPRWGPKAELVVGYGRKWSTKQGKSYMLKINIFRKLISSFHGIDCLQNLPCCMGLVAWFCSFSSRYSLFGVHSYQPHVFSHWRGNCSTNLQDVQLTGGFRIWDGFWFPYYLCEHIYIYIYIYILWFVHFHMFRVCQPSMPCPYPAMTGPKGLRGFGIQGKRPVVCRVGSWASHSGTGWIRGWYPRWLGHPFFRAVRVITQTGCHLFWKDSYY